MQKWLIETIIDIQIVCFCVDLLFAYLSTDTAKEIFNDEAREYGNGLKKFEPNDLNNAKILNIFDLDISIKQAT